MIEDYRIDDPRRQRQKFSSAQLSSIVDDYKKQSWIRNFLALSLYGHGQSKDVVYLFPSVKYTTIGPASSWLFIMLALIV